MDQIDKNILKRLQEDASRTTAELADDVGLSLSACAKRVARLRRSGTISAVIARLDPKKFPKPVSVPQFEVGLPSPPASPGEGEERAEDDECRGGADQTSARMTAGGTGMRLMGLCLIHPARRGKRRGKRRQIASTSP